MFRVAHKLQVLESTKNGTHPRKQELGLAKCAVDFLLVHIIDQRPCRSHRKDATSVPESLTSSNSSCKAFTEKVLPRNTMDDHDELMGPRRSQPNKTASPALVSPDASPSMERRSSSGAPPPANAFVHTSTNERWAQYERDSKLEQDSALAYANAVASAATRAANESGGRSPYQDIPPADRVRAEALKVLEKAGDDVSPYRLHQTRTGGLTTGQAEPYSFRRSSSSNVEKNRAEPYSFRRSASTASSASDNSSKRRTPAALAGLDMSNPTPSRVGANKWTIDDDDLAMDEDEDVLVDIVDMENRITGSGGGYKDDPSGGYQDEPKERAQSWSSRYSVDKYLSGGVTTKDMLDKMDQEQQRLAKSARNMFMSSPSQNGVPPAEESTNIFGRGFKFRHGGNTTLPRDYNLRAGTIWSDGDMLSSNGNSLPPPLPDTKDRWGNGIERARRRRRRLCIGAIVAVCAAVVIAVSVGKTKSARANPFSFGNTSGQGTAFYVVADVPYDASEETKLSRDLAALPGDAAFVIHLGNIQDASVTLCPESAYEDASAVLKTSPIPVFVLPGENDWNNCPNPDAAWTTWSKHFIKFERNFDPDFMVLYQKDSGENFSILYDGVLFIGLHLVGGRINNQEEWNARHAKNVAWVGENIHAIHSEESFRAVVLLGNARPSNQQRTFFNEVLDDIQNMGKPVVYIHANAGNGTDFEEYKPYNEVDNLMAVQIEDGGHSPPLRVAVDFGGNPFQVG